MTQAIHDFVFFLVLSSLHLLVLGGVAWVSVVLMKAGAGTAYKIYMMVLVVPLLSTLYFITPFEADVSPLVGRVFSEPVQEFTPQLPVYDYETDKAIGTAQRPGTTGSMPASHPSNERVFSSETVLLGNSRSTEGHSEGIMRVTVVPDREKNSEFIAWIKLNWRYLLSGLWLLGVILFSGRIAIGIQRQGNLISKAKKVDESHVLDLLARCARLLGVTKPPCLAVSGELKISILAGFFKPIIVLPVHLMEAGNEEGLRFTLLHELSHYKRRHHSWLMLELLIETLYFFHPVVRWIMHRISEEREYLCYWNVMKVIERRSTYADFLLHETWNLNQPCKKIAALPFLSKMPVVAKRINRILAERRTSMFVKFRDVTAFFLVFTVLMGTVAIRCKATPTTVPSADPAGNFKIIGDDPDSDTSDKTESNGEEKPDHTNASPMEGPGIYHVCTVYESLMEVKVSNRSDKQKRTVPSDQWTFDKTAGRLEIETPIDDDQEMVIVYGKLEVPWAWQMTESLEPGSVKVLLDDRPGVRGVDFETDEEKGVIRFLKKELCHDGLEYYISFNYPRDRSQPQIGRGGAIGNHSDRKAVRRFLGLPEEEGPGKDQKNTVGTNASPTSDPRVYSMVRPMQSESIRVAVADRKKAGDLNWLEKGEDYIYNEETGLITLLKEIVIDPEISFMFVSGIPANRGIFNFGKTIAPESTEVWLNGRQLIEGVGYTVDVAKGSVTVLDPAIKDKGAEFYIRSGGRSFGNGAAPSLSSDPTREKESNQKTIIGKRVSRNALPTRNSRVFKLPQSMISEGLQVCLEEKENINNTHLLNRDEDYSFNQEDKLITLIKDIPVDFDRQQLVVEGSLIYSHVVTFTTETNAPPQFDCWTFYWTTPHYLKSAELDYVVLDPEGGEFYEYFMGQSAQSRSSLSDFGSEVTGKRSDIFFDKPIRFVLRVSEGPMKIPLDHGFHFDFYRANEDGTIDRNHPIATIRACAEDEALRNAAVIPPDIDLNDMMPVNIRGSRKPDLHWQSISVFHNGQYDRCIQNLKKVVAEQPKRNWSWYLLGRAFFESGDMEGALDTFTHLVSICPWSPYLYEKGRVLETLGREEEAAIEYGKAFEILDSEHGYKSFIYADETIEGRPPRTKEEIIKLLKSDD